MGRTTVQDVKRPDVATLMKKLAYKQAEANRSFGVLRKMFNLAEVWDCALTARIHAATRWRTILGRASAACCWIG